jgi:ABC-type oligopeptide transport system substrate-binding subunit
MERKISRRQLLKGAGLVVMGAAGNGLLAACGGPAAPAAGPTTAATDAALGAAPTAAAETTPAPAAATTAAVTAAPATGGASGAAGASLPPDALAADKQIWVTGIGQTGGGFGHIMESLYNRAFEHNGGAESLTTLNNDLEVVGVGAESWKASDDGLSWDFKLRQGLTFSDGRPVTAKDWVYTLRHSLSNKYDFGWFYFDIKNASKLAEGKAKPEELGIEALDDYTLRITTEAPTPYLPALGVWFCVAPDQAWEKLGENWALDPAKYVSSGPFILKEFQRDVQHRWTRNDKYSGSRKVYFTEIQEKTLPKGLPPYIAGDVQGYTIDSTTPAGEVAMINGNPVLKSEQHPQPSSYTDYLGFNTLAGKFKPLDNPDVRMALSKAIDKEQLVKDIFRGLADPAWGILPKGFPNYIGDELKGLDPNKYDPAVAKQLLSKAGYADGKNFPKLELWVRQPTPAQSALAQAIQARWKENLGIEVELKPADFQSFTDTVFTKKNAPMYYVGYSLDYYDPATFLNVFRSTGRHPHEDKAWDDFYNKANANLKLDERMKQLQEAEKRLVNSTAWYFLANPFSVSLWPCNLAGEQLKPNKSGYQFNGGGGVGSIHAFEGMYWSNSDCRKGVS